MAGVPGNRPDKTFFEGHAGAETELALGARHIQAAARLAVGLGRVPDDPTREPGVLRDQLDKILD
jgi:hypothetical protein